MEAVTGGLWKGKGTRRNQRKESEEGTERQVVGVNNSKEARWTQVPFCL